MKVIEEKTFIKGQEDSLEGPIQIQAYKFKCPGCNHTHSINVNPNYSPVCWGFNGNIDKPTFTPSLLATSGHYVTGESPADCWPCQNNKNACYICHSFITNGRIQFLGDCTHELKGQTVDLPEIV